MSVEVKPLAEINRQALQLLFRELGVVDAVRFLKQFMPGLGDYTAERDVLLGGKTVEQIAEEIARARKDS